ncbi:MAG: hypothetical protein OXF82_08730 [Gammaproteobacteria bacterium]|nr:hypothetical protein [Gammaproteobacteria bacterium]
MAKASKRQGKQRYCKATPSASRRKAEEVYTATYRNHLPGDSTHVMYLSFVGAKKSVITPELMAILALGISILAFLWNIQRDIGILRRDHTDLRERMSRLEGLFAGLNQRESASAR